MPFKAEETIYFVEDMEEAIRFYTESMGFRLDKQYGFGFALIDVDGQGGRIGLMHRSVCESEYQTGRPGPRLTLKTDDIEAEVKRLCVKGVEMTAIEGQKGENRAVTVRTSTGDSIFIYEDGTGTLS